MLDYPEDLQLDLSSTTVRSAIPKFHLYAHKDTCQAEENLNYLPNVGRTYGEGVKTTWAHMNLAAASTREMGMFARQETLNDHWMGWNWRKYVYMGKLTSCMNRFEFCLRLRG